MQSLLKISQRSCAFLVLLLMASCSNPDATLTHLREKIAAYPSEPTEENSRKIEALFLQLDEQIAKMQSSGQTVKASAFRDQRNQLKTKFGAAKIGATLGRFESALQSVGDAIGNAGREIGEAIRDVAPESSPSKTDP